MLEFEVKDNSPVAFEMQRASILHGESAYQIAVENGFEGTEQEWLDSLHGKDGLDGAPGPKGDTGPQGPKGEAFTYSDFTPEQLADLKGPKGEKGDKGDKGDTGAAGPTGATGDTGPTGPQGPSGYTPVRGKDYWTGADKTEIVNDVLANMPENGGGESIIDVTALPTDDIDEKALYRLLTGTFVFNQFVQNTFTCYCVDTLPEVGEPATTDMTTITAYYNVSDGVCYGYVDANLSSALSVPTGWYDMGTLLPAAGYAYGGVITDIMDDPNDYAIRLLLEYVLYSYKDEWTSLKIIGKAGTGASAEVFNHPSNKASGDSSHAEGYSSHAEGRYSHAEGRYSHAEGDSSHAEGYSSHAEGEHSHAEGDSSHAEGYSSHAEGDSSHAEGEHSHTEGRYSHAEGRGYYVIINITGDANATTYTVSYVDALIIGASIRYTVYVDNVPSYNTAKIIAIDIANSTITVNRTLSDVALSNQSVGVYVAGLALGDNSHSEGKHTIAAGRSQHVQGEYNIVDPEYDVNNNDKRGKYVHIVGNGTSNNARSNAHTLDWDGNAWFAGGIELTSPNGTRYRFTVSDDGTLSASPVTE